MSANNELVLASQFQRLRNYITDVTIQIFIIFFVDKYFFPMNKQQQDLSSLIILQLVITLYYFVFEAIWGKTLGKFLTRTVVVDLYGNKPSVGRILLRTVCRSIPFLPFSVLFHKEGLGWHDLISKTRIIDEVDSGLHSPKEPKEE